MLEIIKALAEKAGAASHPAFIELTASPQMQALKDLKLDPEVEKAFNANLINLETAKTHKDIIKHIKGQELGKVDETLATSLKESGLFTEDAIKEIMSVGSTAEKVAVANKKIKEATGKAPKTEESEKIKALIRDNQELQSKIGQVEGDWSNKYKSLESSFDGFKLKTQFTKDLTKHTLRKDLTPSQIALIAENEINERVAAKGGKIVLTERGIQVLDKDTNEPLLDSDKGKSFSFNEMLEKILSENNLLQVTRDDSKQKTTTQASSSNARTTSFDPKYDAQLLESIQAKLAN